MSEHQASISTLRCADSDRELVAGVLNKAYADGRLTFEEHDERITKAYVARTFGDLDGLTTDLIPDSRPLAAPRQEWAPQPQAQAWTPAPPRPAAPPARPGRFAGGTTILSSLRPGGPLHLAEHTDLTVVLGDARLDLVNATFDASTAVINVNVILGELRIRVPEGVTVVSNLAAVMGEYKSRGTVPARGGLTVHLTGRVFLGEVQVLGPDSRPGRFQRFTR